MAAMLDLHVSLRSVLPRPWRRFLRADGTFADLHQAIQDACGWWDYHLYVFKASPDDELAIAGRRLEDGDDDLSGAPVPDAARVRLRRIFPDRATTCVYLYDSGDGWELDVLLLDLIPRGERGVRRRLVGGEHAWPPEDCGGPWGYAETLAALAGEGDAERAAWIRGRDWSPTFDLESLRERFDR